MKRFVILFAILIAVFMAIAIYSTNRVETQPSYSALPIDCGWDAVKPHFVNDSPCPGAVYCSYGNCGEYCCPWGYFYSNPCTCRCYRTSYDAGQDCDSYFRCNQYICFVKLLKLHQAFVYKKESISGELLSEARYSSNVLCQYQVATKMKLLSLNDMKSEIQRTVIIVQ